MKRRFAFTFFLVLGMTTALACDIGNLSQSNRATEGPTVALVLPVVPPATATKPNAIATAAPTTGAVPAGQIFYQDTLSDSKGGWQTKKEDCCEWLYLNGAYHIRVFKNNLTVYSLLPNQTFEDTTVEVDAARDSGSPDHLFGLGCRVSSDYSQGYIFLVRSDGAHVIVKVTGDNRKELVFGKQSAAIRPTTGTNHLRADCLRDTLTLSVNGEKLIETKDSEYKKGQPGLVVLSQGSSSIDVRFQNFLVRAP